MRVLSLLSATLIATTSVAALSTSVLAQQAAPSGQTVELEPIIIEAESAKGPVQGYVARRSTAGSKTDTDILETPQAVSVITRDQLEARGVQNLGQALNYSAGVQGQGLGPDARFDNPYIRGFNANNSIYIDSLKVVRGLGAISYEPYGFERIEVLRGPSSVLYGQGNPGGLINFVSKRPTWDRFGEVNLSGGSFDRLEGSLDINQPINDNFSIRIVALARTAETQMNKTEDDRLFLAPSLSWRNNNGTSLTVLGMIQHDQSLSPIGLPRAGTLDFNPLGRISRSTYIGEPGFDDSDRTTAHIGYEFEHQFNETWAVRQNLRYAALDWNYQSMYLSGGLTDNRTQGRGAIIQTEESGTFTVDNQIEANFTTGPLQHTVLAGLDIRHYSLEETTQFFGAGGIDVFTPVYGNPAIGARFYNAAVDSDLLQVGAYVQDQIAYDRWRLTVGLRHDWADIETTNTGNNLITNQDDTAFTGRAGLSYLFDNGLAPYVSYSTSFEPVPGVVSDGSAAQPSEGEQYELGVKYRPANFNGFFTATVFDLTQSNVSSADPSLPATLLQTGEVQVQGLELEATATLTQGLNLTASYSLLDAEISNSVTPSDIGNRPLLVAEQNASLWLDYTFQDGSMLKGFGFGGGVRYVGERFADNANLTKLESTTLFDAAIHYKRDNFKAQLNVNNIADEEFVSNCGFAGCYFGEGRTVQAKLTYTW